MVQSHVHTVGDPGLPILTHSVFVASPLQYAVEHYRDGNLPFLGANGGLFSLIASFNLSSSLQYRSALMVFPVSATRSTLDLLCSHHKQSSTFCDGYLVLELLLMMFLVCSKISFLDFFPLRSLFVSQWHVRRLLGHVYDHKG
ncbi:hypothetical protein TNCV_748851 [Trichonephila clavipes]|nr:hypothetical protein TNCV_748851 [Trichonephila clavipes]